MPLNAAVFKERALTAGVFVAVMLTGLLWNEWSFFILFSIVHFGCWVEFNRLMESIRPIYARVDVVTRVSVMAAGWMMMLYAGRGMLPGLGFASDGDGITVVLLVLLAVAILSLLRSGIFDRRVVGVLGFGLVYISLSWALLVHLRSGAIWDAGDAEGSGFASSMAGIGRMAGFALPLIIIATIWLNDTMAYLAGSLIGRTPLSAVSPKKTWEGTISGVVISVLLVTFAAGLWIDAKPYAIASISAVTAVTGTFGDLFESKLKRMAGVKDSGSFMPGHGGFLDRFDSLLVAVPFAWILCTLFLR